MNIAIVKAFIALKEFALNYKELTKQIKELRLTTDNHNEQLAQIYDALQRLMVEKEKQKKWADRERIGFKK